MIKNAKSLLKVSEAYDECFFAFYFYNYSLDKKSDPNIIWVKIQVYFPLAFPGPILQQKV